jgi:hypothetical protein
MPAPIDDIAVRAALERPVRAAVAPGGCLEAVPLVGEGGAFNLDGADLHIRLRLFRAREVIVSNAHTLQQGFLHVEVWIPDGEAVGRDEQAGFALKELFTLGQLLDGLVCVSGIALLNRSQATGWDEREVDGWASTPLQIDYQVNRLG